MTPTDSKASQTRIRSLLRRIGRRRLLVLMGGRSAERNISLLTGKAVLHALRGLKVNVEGLDLRSARDVFRLWRRPPAVAVLCLHGPQGEDGVIQGALEWMGIPYTGSGVLASALGMDKHRAKQVLLQNGLPTAPWNLLTAAPWPKTAPRPLPVVVKPNRQGSAIGVSIVRTPGQWQAALRLARRFDSEVVVEKYCPGVEISVSVLLDRALPIVEIVPNSDFYDYKAKYSPGGSEHILPARLARSTYLRAQRLALAAHRALGCRGLSRVDMIVGSRGRLDILEINTMPGLTATSLFPDAARHAGIPFPELVLRLVAEAMGA